MRHDPERDITILEAFEQYLDDYGFPPTVRELMRATGIPSGGIVGALDRLAKKGKVVKINPGHARAYTTPAALAAIRERNRHGNKDT